MCSMLLTVVVSARSSVYTIRCSISFALRPVYCQMTLTTGMLMDGKISVGVRSRINGVNNNSSRAATTNVYGRRKARRTIHISVSSIQFSRDGLLLHLVQSNQMKGGEQRDK